jgi:hypothetical protein
MVFGMNSENISVIAERIANSGVASHHTFEVGYDV